MGKYRGAEEDIVRESVPDFCRGAQAEARNCRFAEPAAPAAPGVARCCLGTACVSKVDLLANGLPADASLAERQILDASSALLRLLPPKPTPTPRLPTRPRGGRASRWKGRGLRQHLQDGYSTEI